MPLTLHFSFHLQGQHTSSPDKLLERISALIPSPPPADLYIEVSFPDTFIIKYSMDFPDKNAAAIAAHRALTENPPT